MSQNTEHNTDKTFMYSVSTGHENVRETAEKYAVLKLKKQGEYTVEDYYNWPEEERVELVDGHIIQMAAPDSIHQIICAELTYQFSSYIRKKGGNCRVFFAPLDVQLDEDEKTMVQPDLILLCNPDRIRRYGIWGAPDFLLEIISPSTSRHDYICKLQKYKKAGVREYWIVDFYKKLLVTYSLKDDYVPQFHTLTGKAAVSIYEDDLLIDLGAVRAAVPEGLDHMLPPA